MVSALVDEGLSLEEARKRCWFVDSKGLVVKSRTDLTGHKLDYAHDHEVVTDFLTAVQVLRPTAIIGVSGQAGRFNKEVLETMAVINERPIVFSLSNPTSKTECTAEQAYTWTDGKAVFASGSPFPEVTFKGKKFISGQGNNVYIFPGIGMGVMASWATQVTNEMFLVAARILAKEVSETDLRVGRVYPPLPRIREVSKEIAIAVADLAYTEGLASRPRPENLEEYIDSLMYEPEYQSYV
ncbi:MAG: hypothetical protein ACD_75C00475G0001 [uncultured bacterium]|nr:MAG: hypothetical protein ACD_75C00475G0001 [uncultured bacterium]